MLRHLLLELLAASKGVIARAQEPNKTIKQQNTKIRFRIRVGLVKAVNINAPF